MSDATVDQLPDDAAPLDDELVHAAMHCRARLNDLTVLRHVGDAWLVWGGHGRPGVLNPLAGAVVPFFDGEVTLGTLAVDLAAALEVPLDQAQQFVAGLALDLTVNVMADGMGPLASVLSERSVPPVQAAQRLTEYTEVREGITYEVTELVMPAAEFRERFANGASPAQMVETGSCLGKRLHLDRPGTVVRLESGPRPVAVRTDDDELLEWLASLPAARVADGPVEAFVVRGSAGTRRDLWRVHDGYGRLVADPRSSDDLRTAVASLVCSVLADDAAPERGVLPARVLIRDGRAVLAGVDTFAGLHGVLRQVERAGVAVTASTWAWPILAGTPAVEQIDPLAAVAALEAGSPSPQEPSLWQRAPLEGVALPQVDGASPEEVHRRSVLLLLRSMDGGSGPRRAAALDGADALLRSVPVRRLTVGESSAVATARELVSAFER
jgi:hypothetical protein